MSFEIYAMLAAIVAMAAFVQGTIGVGFALVVAPSMAILAPDLVPSAVLMLMLPLNVYVIWRERTAIDRSGVSWIMAGRLGGTFGGLVVLTMLSVCDLQVFIGAATILAALATLAAPEFKPNGPAYVAAGLVTGVTETATGIGGPPLALVFQHQPGPVLRASIATCFLIGQVFSLAMLALGDLLTVSHVAATGALLPALVLGGLASWRARQRADGRLLRTLVLAFAILSGAALMI